MGATGAGPQSILIVEDDADIREALAEILRDEGHEVQGAPNGQQALHVLRDGPLPALILLDLMMPVMNGWQFRQAQRQDPVLAPIPVVVISADGAALRESTLMGASGFLQKPIELDELLAVVARYCQPNVPPHAGLLRGG
jgi:CheY-like chemotaxis protein